jgi:FAD/FMN-containing dehydrogenase
MPTALLDALRHITGAAHVYTDGDLSGYTRDWRQRAQGRALAVVLPSSTAQVAAVVRACAQQQARTGISLVPQGGNTGLAVGSVPDTSGQQIVLSLKRMDAIRAVDPANLTITAEAGCVLQTLQDRAADAGLLFPLSLASEGSCTIGGNLGTNAGGTQVLRYGNARELCLGLEVVTAQGQIWHGLSGLRKDNTGYDLRDLYIGSEGTLGIITAATLKLFPQPASQLVAWAAVPSLQAAVDLLGLAQQRMGANLTGFEVMNQFALSLVDRHFAPLRPPLWQHSPWCVLLESSDLESDAHALSGLEQLMDTAQARDLVTDVVVATSLSQAKQLWHCRESISLAQSAQGLNIKHDIALPVSRIPAFVAETDALLSAAIPGVRLVNFGHLGDGNLHYNVQAPEQCAPKLFLQEQEERVNTLVYDAVLRHEGSISAEHGIGSLKAALLPRYKDPVALAVMHSIKQALDPHKLLNPGRVLLR